MMLTAYDPFAATNAAFRALDQLTGRSGSVTARPMSGMPMDAYRVGDNFVAHFDLPGVDPGSIDVDVDGNTLTIRAERTLRGEEQAEWIAQERPSGSYMRQLSVGEGLDLDKIHAHYENGVLSMTIPVSEKAKPRKIEVQSRGGQQQIGATESGGAGSETVEGSVTS